VITLVFEVYGAFCILSLIAFLVLASMAKLRPDLDEEELDFVELEKLKKLAHSEQSDGPSRSSRRSSKRHSGRSRPARSSRASARSRGVRT
jgi:hypothetical protein